MFIIILVSVLRHTKRSGKEGKLKRLIKKATVTLLLAVMFGIGWVFGVLGSVEPGFQYVFVPIVAFQGLLIFILHPCRSKDAREEWKKWLYCVTCRLKAYHTEVKQSKQSNALGSSDHSSSSAVGKRRSTFLSSTGTVSGGPQKMPHPSLALSPIPNTSRNSVDSTANSCSPIPGEYGSSRRNSSGSAAMAMKFGYTGGRRTSNISTLDTLPEKEDLTPVTGTDRERSPPNELVNSGSNTNSLSSSSPLPPKLPRKAVQISVFDNNEELISLGEDTESSSQWGNVIQYASSDVLAFSHETDPYLLINPGADFSEHAEPDIMPMQSFNYDEELESGTATIYYNFGESDDEM